MSAPERPPSTLLGSGQEETDPRFEVFEEQARDLFLLLPRSGLAVLLALVLLRATVPSFFRLYSIFGAELPELTRALVWASDNAMACVVTLVVACALFWRVFFRKDAASARRRLSLPLLGDYVSARSMAKVCWTIQSALARGAPPEEALGRAARAADDPAFEEALSRAAAAPASAGKIPALLSREDLIPSEAKRLLVAASGGGDLQECLADLGDCYEWAARLAYRRLSWALDVSLALALLGLAWLLAIGLLAPFVGLGELA